jgi:beta-ribofuranosylaminobenzene 5'-phosphate synthase
VFHPRAAPVVEAMEALGVGAVGQSSWGPTVYGIVAGEQRAAAVADGLNGTIDAATEIRVVDFDRQGARVARRGSGRAAA